MVGRHRVRPLSSDGALRPLPRVSIAVRVHEMHRTVVSCTPRTAVCYLKLSYSEESNELIFTRTPDSICDPFHSYTINHDDPYHPAAHASVLSPHA